MSTIGNADDFREFLLDVVNNYNNMIMSEFNKSELSKVKDAEKHLVGIINSAGEILMENMTLSVTQTDKPIVTEEKPKMSAEERLRSGDYKDEQEMNYLIELHGKQGKSKKSS